jgi:autotransporter-associated beta strand protein
LANQITGNITAAGLTKFGTGWLNLNGLNTITAPITLNDGILYLQNQLNGEGTATVGATNGQPIILNGGQLNIDTTSGTSTGANLADAAFRRTMVTLNSDLYFNADASVFFRASNNGNANIGAMQRVK